MLGLGGHLAADDRGGDRLQGLPGTHDAHDLSRAYGELQLLRRLVRSERGAHLPGAT